MYIYVYKKLLQPLAILGCVERNHGKGREKRAAKTISDRGNYNPNTTDYGEASTDEGSSINCNENHQQQSTGNGTVSSSSPISATPSRGKVSSYASLVNPDEGASLNFVETSMINGTKCAKIDAEDVTPEIGNQAAAAVTKAQAPSMDTKERTQSLFLADPLNQQLAQKENELRDHYTKILTSVIDILRQQCKANWLTYGDECTRYFFAKASKGRLPLTFLNYKMNKAI
ncbi:hypothetical protein Cgig2_006231 [Carnegiea gigantea]|uniref:Uncharacterized protein n=1 Tax=Carnegiea gigantea TaxID=171969 RepID=A0A9Q1GRC9_9CARY|nr:hypothetical protein Cgig2_006231 [Carnegiea gigantea]